MHDLLLRQARLRHEAALQDVAIAGENVVAVAPRIDEPAREEVAAAGRLLTPAFIDAHIHLDKVLLADELRPNVSGTLAEAIEVIGERKARYTVEDVAARAGRVIERAVLAGTTRLRSHVDVDSIAKLTPLLGVLEARRHYADVISVQTVAFPQEGILRDPGTERLLRAAMEAGCDLVGGMPHWEQSPAASRRHIALCLEVARAYGCDVDMHVDETDDGASRTLEMLAEATIAAGYEGRVTAGHVCALAAYPDDYARQVIAKVRDAGIHIVSNPVTNLMLQGRADRQPVRRGITRVKELLAAGVNVAFGQDCVADGFYPFGGADLLEVALISAHAAHLSTPGEVEQAFDMVTVAPARILKVADYGVAPGAPADLVLIDAPNAREAIRLRGDRLLVLKAGRVVARQRSTKELLRQASSALARTGVTHPVPLN